MSIAMSVPAEQRLVLSGIPWQTYIGVGDLLGDYPIRMTYDRGELEIMTLSPEHERAKHLLVLFLAILAEELDIDVAGYGSMTFRREDLARGLEPDECYWVANEAAVRGRTVIDPTTDPPPDLVIEVEITRNIIDRLPLCAALRVPEIWRWDGQTLRILQLGTDGGYAETATSRAFPQLPIAELAQFLTSDATQSETKRLRALRTWVRQHLADGGH